ncbi:MAG: hypothetical protein IPK83_07580 [Planctomycetes bacterium]|nr:hypothetical protein [Planctomycetota bacterium]
MPKSGLIRRITESWRLPFAARIPDATGKRMTNVAITPVSILCKPRSG